MVLRIRNRYLSIINPGVIPTYLPSGSQNIQRTSFGIWLRFSKIWKRQRTTSSLLVPSRNPPVLHIGECSSHAFPNSPILVSVEIHFHWVHCNKRIGTSLVVSLCINIIWIPPFLTWLEVIPLFTIKWRNHFCPNLKTSNNFGVTCYKLLNICTPMLKLDLLQKNVVQNSHVPTQNIQWKNGKNIKNIKNLIINDRWTIMIMSLIQIYTNLIKNIFWCCKVTFNINNWTSIVYNHFWISRLMNSIKWNNMKW